jgi:hypothetical protein
MIGTVNVGPDFIETRRIDQNDFHFLLMTDGNSGRRYIQVIA